jgi:hypothetical protein
MIATPPRARTSQQGDHKGRPYYATKRFARLVLALLRLPDHLVSCIPMSFAAKFKGPLFPASSALAPTDVDGLFSIRCLLDSLL